MQVENNSRQHKRRQMPLAIQKYHRDDRQWKDGPRVRESHRIHLIARQGPLMPGKQQQRCNQSRQSILENRTPQPINPHQHRERRHQVQDEIEQRHIHHSRQQRQASKKEAGIIRQRLAHHWVIGIQRRIGPLLEKRNLNRLIPHPHAIAGKEHLHDRQQNRGLDPQDPPNRPAGGARNRQ
jgi:hypothetical protein